MLESADTVTMTTPTSSRASSWLSIMEITGRSTFVWKILLYCWGFKLLRSPDL